MITFILLLLAGCFNNSKNESSMDKNNNLTPFFKAELIYDSDVDVSIPTKGRIGEYIGSGKGTLKGELNGDIHWQFFAENCAYLWVKEGETPPENQHLCKTNPGGIIKTKDGAEIQFDAKGYGFRGYDISQPHLWKLTAALQFHTEDKRYLWLNTVLGVWEGTFNEKEGKAKYQAFIQKQ
jgi:hypothetical protein